VKKFAGIFILIAVIIAVVVFSKQHGTIGSGTATADLTTVTGYVGGEKLNLLKDPDVVSILRDKYKLDVRYDRRGSLEMARDKELSGKDYLWPSSQVALEVFKDVHGKPLESELLFNSPIVLYSWANVTDALVKQNIVSKSQNTYYVSDFPKLISLVNKGATWASIGLPDLYGKVAIYSTDPTQSNSGNMFAGLLANVVNGSSVVNEATLPGVLPTVKKFFDNQGFMETSSDVIFTQYLNKGVGDKPIIVGYESQLIEFSISNQSAFARRNNDVRMLYPKPTVWSSHPLIALTENGRKLIAAMQDPEIQRLSWENHGFRSATGATNDTSTLGVKGVPDNLQTIVPMPSARVMERIINALGG
jgi:hypothetical protein